MASSEVTSRITLTLDEVSAIQDSLYFHPLNDDGNVFTDEDRWERDQLRKAKGKIDRAYARLERATYGDHSEKADE